MTNPPFALTAAMRTLRQPFDIGGRRYQWQVDTFDGLPYLSCLEPPREDGCCNPWTHFSPEIRAVLRQARPPCSSVNDVVANKPVMLTRFHHGGEEIKNYLREIIGADCWMVYTTSSNRTALGKVYFDLFQEERAREPDAVRMALMDNPDPLLITLHEGDCIHLVMNHAFIDIIVRQLPETESYVVTELHYRL